MVPQAKDVMTRNLFVVPVGTLMSQAQRLMAEKRIRHLPVFDDTKGMVGVLSKSDFPALAELKELRVEHFMNSPVIFVSQDAALRSTIFKMLEEKISSVIVTNRGQEAVGIVTTDDLLWYLVHRMEEKSPKAESRSASSVFDLHTLGQVIDQIALAGI